MQNDIPMSRDFYLYGPITDENTGFIINNIIEINKEDLANNSMFQDYMCDPVRIFINSYGGEIHDALALVDVIDASVTPVQTFVYGKAMGCACDIAIASQYRYCYKNATYMLRDDTTTLFNGVSSIDNHIDIMKHINKAREELWSEKTDYKFELNKTKIFTAKDALEHKLVDAVVGWKSEQIDL